MIKINLTPVDELENPFEFLPDGFAIVAAFAACYWYMGNLEQEKLTQIEEVEQETAQVRRSYNNIKGDLEKFKDMENQVGTLNSKIESLRQITVSKLSKYELVILLEHLQTLKPDGLWYEKIKVDSDGKKIEAEGKSFDPILVAEFMSGLDQTKIQKVDPVDVRTQVYFDNVEVVSVTQQPKAQGGNVEDAINLENYPAYKLNLKYKTREVAPEDAEIN